MTDTKAKRPKRGYATLPNCDRCGRFTSAPAVRSWCVGSNSGYHACFEELLCPTCETKRRQEDPA